MYKKTTNKDRVLSQLDFVISEMKFAIETTKDVPDEDYFGTTAAGMILFIVIFSYFPFDDIIKEKTLTLEQAYDTYLLNGAKGRILQQEDTDLFPRLAKSKRFGKMKLSNYINKLDPKQEKQFSAITFELPDNTIYVAYHN